MILPIGYSCGVSYSSINFKACDINAFKQVDETLYRGARLRPVQMQNLKDLGISTIIDFSTEMQKFPNYSEESAAKSLGMKYFKLPFASCENPSDAIIKEFFDIADAVKSNREKMFIHCFEGKDRTGLFTELYKIKYGLSNAQKSIESLLKGKYNFSSNPLAKNLIVDFAKKVRP